jgi:glyoxylase-like metal-dependent hydrolase (beta-lactamase superfamily II)
MHAQSQSFAPPTKHRQWLPATGPQWTSLRALNAEGHKNDITQVEANVYSIVTTPKVGIGQRCLLLQHSGAGNVLWDCCAFLDEATIEAVKALGGVRHIVLSHPHFLGSCITWSKVFGDARIYLQAFDKDWVTRPDERCEEKGSRYLFWTEDFHFFLGGVMSLRAARLGGHFKSSSVLLLESSAEDGKAIMFTGDTILPVPHGRWCSFMYSFPNLLPLPAFVVEEIKDRVEGLPDFDRLYGPFATSSILGNAKEAVLESAQRYLNSLAGKYHGK